MCNLKRGELIIGKCDDKDVIQLVCANSYVKNDGSLSMSKGKNCSGRIDRKFPNLSKDAGDQIDTRGKEYNLLWMKPDGYFIGLFQTRFNYGGKHDLGVLVNSVKKLASVALARPNKSFRLDWPISAGAQGISWEKAKCMLSVLPNNVTVYASGVAVI